jgi:hypothetical protein
VILRANARSLYHGKPPTTPRFIKSWKTDVFPTKRKQEKEKQPGGIVK